MGARIIKVGKKDNSVEYRGNCDYCGTVFSFTKNDGEYNSSSSPMDGDEEWVELPCPYCGKTIYPHIGDANRISLTLPELVRSYLNK